MKKYIFLLFLLWAVPGWGAPITSGTVYVNTASPGVDDADCGDTSGNACATLAYTVANRIAQLTGAMTINCVGAGETLSGKITLSGISTAAYKLTIKGDRWTDTTNGAWSESKYHLDQTNYDNDMFYATELNLEFDGLQLDLKTTGSGDTAIDLLAAAAAQTITIKNCIFNRSGADATSMMGILGTLYAGSTVSVTNCIFSNFAGTTNRAIYTVATVSNCTFYNCTIGIVESSTVKNCLFISCAAHQVGGSWNAASDYNSSTLNTAFDPAGTYNHINIADANLVSSTDFRPTATSGDPNVRNSGATIAAASPDPLGTTRPSQTNYTRGAFEYIPAVSSFHGLGLLGVGK